MSEDVVIVGMARTPMRGLLGDLASFTAPELGAAAVKAAVQEGLRRATRALNPLRISRERARRINEQHR